MAITIQLGALLLIITIVFLFCSEVTIWKILLASLLLIPSSMQGLISGVSYSTNGIINLSMVGYVTIISAFVMFGKKIILLKKESIIVFTCFFIIILVRILADGFNFVSNKILDNYFLPMLVAILLASKMRTEYIPELLKFIYKCIFFGAIIACIEYVYGQSLFFHEYYMSTVPWYVTIYNSAQYVAFRSTSLFGHPLIGAIYYLIGVVYLINCKSIQKNRIMWCINLAVLLLAILSTNSRSALFGLGIYTVIYLLVNKKIGKLAAATVVIVVLAFSIDWNSIYALLFARDNSGTSIMVRVNAILSLVDIPFRTILFGEGYNSTSSLLKSLGFTANVEISYLIIFIENGIIGFSAWILSIITLFKIHVPDNEIRGVKVSSALNGFLFIIFVVGAMSNSFGDPGTLNYMIYICLGMTTALSRLTVEEVEYIESMSCSRRKIRFTFGNTSHLD